jgi:hypothetical protein
LLRWRRCTAIFLAKLELEGHYSPENFLTERCRQELFIAKNYFRAAAS